MNIEQISHQSNIAELWCDWTKLLTIYYIISIQFGGGGGVKIPGPPKLTLI